MPFSRSSKRAGRANDGGFFVVTKGGAHRTEQTSTMRITEPRVARSAALALIAAAPAVLARPARAATPVTVRIGVQPVESAGQAFYGKDLGWFDQAGLDVQITPLSNGGALVAGVISGALDIGLSAVGPIAQAFAKGFGVRIIAPAGMSLSTAPTIITMVALDSPIKTAADLNGKTVAVNGLGNALMNATQTWIDKNGGVLVDPRLRRISSTRCRAR